MESPGPVIGEYSEEAWGASGASGALGRELGQLLGEKRARWGRRLVKFSYGFFRLSKKDNIQGLGEGIFKETGNLP